MRPGGIGLVVATVATVLAAGCESPAPPAVEEDVVIESGTVLDPSDMDRLLRTRRDLIERGTPLGEEEDQTAALRARMERLTGTR